LNKQKLELKLEQTLLNIVRMAGISFVSKGEAHIRLSFYAPKSTDEKMEGIEDLLRNHHHSYN
jgi:hypothetical protein